MLSQAKLYILGAILLVIVSLGVTVYVQHGQKKLLRMERDQVINANETNDKTIKELKAERDKAGVSCARRISDKDRLLADIMKIRETKGANDEQRAETTRNEVAAADTCRSGDPLLGLLNGVLPPAGGQDGVHQAGGPAGACGAQMVPCQVYYCFASDDDVRNFASDWALCRAWALEGVGAIEGMR